MSEPEHQPATSGTCWFCQRRQGDLNSLAMPFWSNQDESVRVLIIPRCTPCYQHHERGKMPSGLMLIGFIAGCMLLLKGLFLTVLPVPESWQSPSLVLAMIVGLILGLLLVSWRESKLAAAAGTKPSSATREHPEYQALLQDRTHWRDRYSAAATSGAFRRDTVTDRRLEFQANTLLAPAAAALEAAVQASGIRT